MIVLRVKTDINVQEADKSSLGFGQGMLELRGKTLLFKYPHEISSALNKQLTLMNIQPITEHVLVFMDVENSFLWRIDWLEKA